MQFPSIPASACATVEDRVQFDSTMLYEPTTLASVARLIGESLAADYGIDPRPIFGQLKIDTGIDQRTIVSGIAEYFNAEEIIGKQISVLVNLVPRKLRGIESQGMILMAENPDGSLYFVTSGEGPINGAIVK